MNTLKHILGVVSVMTLPVATYAQNHTVQGKVTDPVTKKPISGAVISGDGLSSSITTDSLGNFTMNVPALKGEITVWYPGFYKKNEAINGRTKMNISLVPENSVGYSENINIPFAGYVRESERQSSLHSIQKKDMKLSASSIESLLYGIPGLQVIQKSGMPGEGAYIRFRGNNSYLASNAPLIVIDGVPYMPDMSESAIIGGYSKSVFTPFNTMDIEHITLLKGADAAAYGSMASNGVLLIETDKATNLDTKVEYIGQFGLNMNNVDMPVMGVADYKKYVGNLAMTQYSDMNDILTNFPYLIDDPDFYSKYLYNNNTDWQDQIYSNGFTTDNVLKIKGGDAIAKYDISIGYSNNDGQMVGTGSDKYYSRINADINLSKKFSMFSTLSLASSSSELMEQGMINESNPFLASLKKAPIFSPYKKDADNNLSPDYAVIRDEEGELIKNNMVSNPLALVNLVEAKSQLYDVEAMMGLKYRINNDLFVLGKAGFNYNYNRQSIFIPGVTQMSIMPQENMIEINRSYSNTIKTFNMYYSASANYNKVFDGVHNWKGSIGTQSAMTHTQLDAAGGRNTQSDFYKSINNTNSIGREVVGIDTRWNWMNIFANAQYIYNNIVGAGVTMALDGSSATGTDASRFGMFPGVNAIWYASNTPVINEIEWLSKASLRAEYITEGNSRYDGNLSKYYYQSKLFRNQSSIVSGGVPNTELKWETTRTFDLGIDFGAFDNRINVTADYYLAKTSDMIVPQNISSAFGTNRLYINSGEVKNTGIELGLQLTPIMTRNFSWVVGATFSKNKNEVVSLPNGKSLISDFGDGSAVITEVGSPMFSYYGYRTEGVFATSEEAEAANLSTPSGKKFAAGDMKFVDVNGDHIINEKDRVNLGSASPDYYGNIYTNIRYKAIELSANFTYSKGNMMYNAVRRSMESMSDYGNQYKSVARRWSQEGQITDIPRATYGDPMNNSRFSDRWIEDASYIKLKELMISYKFNVMNGITVYAAGENLFTLTKYLGADPETMYSYDTVTEGFDYAKVALAKTVKIGVKLQF